MFTGIILFYISSPAYLIFLPKTVHIIISRLRHYSTIDNQALERIIICRIPSAGKGFMPFLKKCPNR